MALYDIEDVSCLERNLSESLRCSSFATCVQEYRPEQQVAAYCERTPQVAVQLGSCISASPLLGSIYNQSFLVSGSKCKLAVKLVEGFVFTPGVTTPLSLARLSTEATVISIVEHLAPGTTPPLVHTDTAAQVLATEFIEDAEPLGTALVRGHIYPGLGQQLGEAFGRLARGTSPSTLGPEGHSHLNSIISLSADCKALIEAATFVEPFTTARSSSAACWPRELDPEVSALLHHNQPLLQEVEDLRRLFRSPPADQCVLIHTDAWAGNILCGAGGASDAAAAATAAGGPAGAAGGASDPGAAAAGGGVGGGDATSKVYIIDWEFACMGPVTYDIGHTLGQLLLALNVLVSCVELEQQGLTLTTTSTTSTTSSSSSSTSSSSRPGQCHRDRQLSWLMSSLGEAWQGFITQGLLDPQAGHLDMDLQQQQKQQQEAAARLLPDALGFAATTLLRWSLGGRNFYDALGLPAEGAARVGATRRAIHLGAQLLVGRRQLGSIAAVLDLVREVLTWDEAAYTHATAAAAAAAAAFKS